MRIFVAIFLLSSNLSVNAQQPNAEHLNRLWGEEKPLDLALFNFEKCKNGKNNTIRQDMPECIPDTVYSWGPIQKITNLKEDWGNGSWQSQYRRAIYTTLSPISTFGYGNYGVRIKLRKDVNWEQKFPMDDGGIAVSSQDSNIVEIDFRSSKYVESWSYGLKEHYDEIIREYQHLSNPACTSKDCELYYYLHKGLDFFGWHVDGHSSTEIEFWENMKIFYDMIITGDGGLFCNPDVPKEKCTLEEHFKTTRPIYYNPD